MDSAGGFEVSGGSVDILPALSGEDSHCWRLMSKTGKDVLKVLVVEQYQFGGGKYGISCFNPPPDFANWKSWPIGPATFYAAPANASKVIVRDPENGGKYASILEFRPT